MTARVTTADDVFAGRVVVHDHTVTVIDDHGVITLPDSEVLSIEPITD